MHCDDKHLGISHLRKTCVHSPFNHLMQGQHGALVYNFQFNF